MALSVAAAVEGYEPVPVAQESGAEGGEGAEGAATRNSIGNIQYFIYSTEIFRRQNVLLFFYYLK